MLRVILVDDERLARQGLADMLARHAEIQIVGEAASSEAAAKAITTARPDAIFLDIEMPGASGFDLLEDIEHPTKVVFVTAHNEYAVRAFAVQAVDYLLKPIRPERLALAVERLTAAVARREEVAAYQREDRICLRTPQRTLVAPVHDVVAIEAEGDFARYHVAGQKPLLICRSLSACEQALPSPPFLRVSRSLLLNLDKILAIEHASRNLARLTVAGSDQVFALGRRAQAAIKTGKQRHGRQAPV